MQTLLTVLDDEEENIETLYRVTSSEILWAGWLLFSFMKKQYWYWGGIHIVNHDRFKSILGAMTLVLCTINKDLQKSTIEDDSFEVKLAGYDIKLKKF